MYFNTTTTLHENILLSLKSFSEFWNKGLCVFFVMAKNTSTVYLGFEDEAISEKNKSLVDFMTNKVGGPPVRLKFFFLSSNNGRIASHSLLCGLFD